MDSTDGREDKLGTASTPLTTAQKLWLGFGALTTLLALSAVAILVRAGAVEGAARQGVVLAATLVSVAAVVAVGVGVAVGRSILRAERHVEDDRQFAVSIVDTVHEPLLVLDGDLRVVRANRSFYEAFKATPEGAEGRRLYDLGNGQWDIPKLRTLLEDVLPQNAQVRDYDVSHSFPNIGPRVMRLNARRLLRQADRTPLVLLAVEDITDRERAEQALQRSEARSRAVVDAALDCVITIDHDGNVVEFNPAAEQTFGRRRADVLGRDMGELIVPPPMRDRHRAGMARYLATGDGPILNRRLELTAVRADGSEFPVELTVTPIPGTPPLFTGHLRDITDRKRAEQAAADARAYAENIVDTVREPLLVLDGDLRVKSASRAFYITFRVAPDETENRPLYELGNGQWDIPALRTLLEEVLPRDAQLNDYEVGHTFPDIGPRTMLLNARKVYRKGNHTALILLAVEDITDRRKAERLADDARRYAESVVETVREPLVILDAGLRVRSANRAFYRAFHVLPNETENRLVYELGNGQWDIPVLRTLLEEILPQNTQFNDYEVEHDFPEIGHRVMMLNARRLYRPGNHTELILLAVEDVTERRKTERRLRESEDRAAFVRKSSGIGFFYCDLPFDVLQWDELVKAHFHLPPDAPVTIDTFYARLHPDDREPTRRAIEQSIKDRTSYDTEYRTTDPATEAVKWVRAIGRTFYADDGTPTRFDGVTLDVTDQRHAETAMREARSFLHATLDALSSHIAVLDAAGTILEVNETWRDFATHNDYTGVNYGIGGNYVEVCEHTAGACDDAGRAVAGLREVMAGRLDTFTMEYPCHGPTERRWFLMRITRFEKDGQPRFVVAHEPITIVKLAEEKLRDSEERYRTLVEQVKEHAIFGTDTAGLATTWNEGVRKVLGFEEAEFVGQDIVPTIFTPEDVASGAARRELDMAAAVGSSSDDRWMLRKDGTRFWAAGITTARRDEDGQLLGYTKVMRDMTAQKAMENELRQLTADLSEANRRKDEFLAMLAHELRNPLAPIRNGLQIMRLSNGTGAGFDKPLTMMERQLGQMVRLVDDLLNVDSAESLSTLLSIMGNEVGTAHDGEQAVAAAEQFRPDVVLLDIGMPKLNGYEACRRIREQPWAGNAVIIALTGWGQDEDRRKSAEAGFDHHLVKPVDPAVLEKLLAGLRPGPS